MGRAAAAALLLILVAATGEARASCASLLYVDRVILTGLHVPPGIDLPPDGGRVSAVSPGCNDTNGANEPDRRTAATRLQGLPPTVAVRQGSTLFLGGSTLLVIGDHPLHAVFRGRVSERRRCHRLSRPVEGHVLSAGFDRIVLQQYRVVRADRRTRFVGRPSYQPLNSDQRVSITASRCGKHVIADRITLTGPETPPDLASQPDFTGDVDDGDDGLPIGLLVVGVPALFLGAVALALRPSRASSS